MSIIKTGNGTTKMYFYWDEKMTWRMLYFLASLRAYLGFEVSENYLFERLLRTQGKAKYVKEKLEHVAEDGSTYRHVISFYVIDNEEIMNDIIKFV